MVIQYRYIPFFMSSMKTRDTYYIDTVTLAIAGLVTVTVIEPVLVIA